jgi:hypothetical protein
MISNSFDDDLYMVEPKKQEYTNCLFGYKKDSTHNKFLIEYEKSKGNENFKTIFIENMK